MSKINQIININLDSFLELEKIGIGAFDPLTGFMTENEFNSVVEQMRLPNGDLFPIPVVLPINEQIVSLIKMGEIIDF